MKKFIFIIVLIVCGLGGYAQQITPAQWRAYMEMMKNSSASLLPDTT